MTCALSKLEDSIMGCNVPYLKSDSNLDKKKHSAEYSTLNLEYLDTKGKKRYI